MRLTRRGRTVAGIALAGSVLAVLFGVRSLNAVVFPALVALGAGVVQLHNRREPAMERVVPENGHPGETRAVRISFEVARPITARVVDEVDEILTTAGNDRVVTIGADDFTYRITLEERGEHELGPLTVRLRDALGLVEREFGYRNSVETVLTYPTVYTLSTPTQRDLTLIPDEVLSSERGDFDRLREYQRGDALRDIHWKTSAKQVDDEFIVKEFTDERDAGTIRIAARGRDGTADAMATAAASIAVYLLNAGVPVGVVVPDGRVEPGTGDDHLRAILDLLARTDDGAIPTRFADEADVLVVGADDPAEVLCRLYGRPTRFGRLAGISPDPDRAGNPPPEAVADGGRRRSGKNAAGEGDPDLEGGR